MAARVTALALLLALGGCPRPAEPSGSPTPDAPSEGPATAPADPTPEPRSAPAADASLCGEVPAWVVDGLEPGLRLVTDTDYVDAMHTIDRVYRELYPDKPPLLCPVARSDFDADGDEDAGALVVDDAGAAHLIVVMTDGTAHTATELRSFPAHPEGAYTALALKEPGRPGPLGHDRFTALSADSPKGRQLVERAGLVVCLPARADDAGLPAALDDSLCYGEETWAFVGGKWQSWRVYD